MFRRPHRLGDLCHYANKLPNEKDRQERLCHAK